MNPEEIRAIAEPYGYGEVYHCEANKLLLLEPTASQEESKSSFLINVWYEKDIVAVAIPHPRLRRVHSFFFNVNISQLRKILMHPSLNRELNYVESDWISRTPADVESVETAVRRQLAALDLELQYINREKALLISSTSPAQVIKLPQSGKNLSASGSVSDLEKKRHELEQDIRRLELAKQQLNHPKAESASSTLEQITSEASFANKPASVKHTDVPERGRQNSTSQASSPIAQTPFEDMAEDPKHNSRSTLFFSTSFDKPVFPDTHVIGQSASYECLQPHHRASHKASPEVYGSSPMNARAPDLHPKYDRENEPYSMSVMGPAATTTTTTSASIIGGPTQPSTFVPLSTSNTPSRMERAHDPSANEPKKQTHSARLHSTRHLLTGPTPTVSTLNREAPERYKGNRCLFYFPTEEYQEEFGKSWSLKPVNCVALGQGYIIVYEDGGISWWDAPFSLDRKFRDEAIHLPAVQYVTLGPDGNYFIKFINGKMEWIAKASFQRAVKLGASERSLYIDKVALGINGAWIILWTDGTVDYEGVPRDLALQLDAIAQGPGLRDISLGPHGEWFAIFKDHSVQANNLPTPLHAALGKIKKSGGRVRNVVFGCSKSWYVRYWDGIN